MGDAETRLTKKMREEASAKYGSRLIMVKYHGNQYGQSGVSDLLCVLDGMFVAAEVKAPESYPVGGRPSVARAESEGGTKLQLSFIAKVEAAGGVGDVVASVPHFLALLERAERKVRDNCGGCREAALFDSDGIQCMIHGKEER